MKKSQKYLIISASVLTVGFLIAGIYFPKDSFSNKEVVFIVEKGEGSREISLNLEKAGLIRWAPLFRVYVLTVGIGGNLQAGDYSLNSSMNIVQIAEKFAKGDVIKDFFTVFEGWDLRDMGIAFEDKGMFRAESFWEIAGFSGVDYAKSVGLPKPRNFSGEFAFLKEKPENVGLEGYLFPDTYRVSRQQTIEEMIRVMLMNFNKKLTMDLRAEINRQGLTVFEAVTMASLIEKEVRTKEDKETVAGILWKRLRADMPLQIDATVSYITGNPGVKISKEETKINSPFNTYKYKGLPAGPISNPGIESIKAVLYPRDSSFWYYLSAPDGATVFSRTFEEHNIAKAKYLK